MTTSSWYLTIARVSSTQSQQELLTILRDVEGVTALGSSSGAEHFVVFECPDLRLKQAIEKLVTQVDLTAVIDEHSFRTPVEPGGGGVA